MYGKTFAQEKPRNTATVIVTAGFKWAPEIFPATYTPIITANPQPSVMFVYPPLTISPGAPVPKRTTMATTPLPNRIRISVPMNSAESSAANVGFLSMAGDSTTPQLQCVI